jgi:hypothetical protein
MSEETGLHCIIVEASDLISGVIRAAPVIGAVKGEYCSKAQSTGIRNGSRGLRVRSNGMGGVDFRESCVSVAWEISRIE